MTAQFEQRKQDSFVVFWTVVIGEPFICVLVHDANLFWIKLIMYDLCLPRFSSNIHVTYRPQYN